MRRISPLAKSTLGGTHLTAPLDSSTSTITSGRETNTDSRTTRKRRESYSNPSVSRKSHGTALTLGWTPSTAASGACFSQRVNPSDLRATTSSLRPPHEREVLNRLFFFDGLSWWA